MTSTIETKILDHLKQDAILQPLIENLTIAVSQEETRVFEALISSIVSQQLSTAAAATIYKRFLDLFESREVISTQLKNIPYETLRSVGLSGQKTGYLVNVADYFEANDLHDTDWTEWADEDIIQTLTQIKGVGKWTVEMILMFSLNRPDVLPLDDLIIRNNMRKLYQVESEKKQLIQDLTEIAEAWRPYRSYACRYLWAAKNTTFIP